MREIPANSRPSPTKNFSSFGSVLNWTDKISVSSFLLNFFFAHQGLRWFFATRFYNLMQSFFPLAVPRQSGSECLPRQKKVNSAVVPRWFLNIGQFNRPNFIQSKTLDLQRGEAISGLFETGISLTPISINVNLSVAAFRHFLESISAGESSWVVARCLNVIYFAVG